MKNIFYFLALIAVGAAGFFGFTAKQKLSDKIVERDSLKKQNVEITKFIGEQEIERDTERESLQVAENDLELSKQGLEAAKSNKGQLQRTLDDTNNQLDEANAREAKINSALEAVRAEFPGVDLAEVPKIVEGLEAEQKELVAELEELEQFKERLTEDVKKNREDTARVQAKIQESKERVAGNTFQATVTAVDNDWDFVVIGAGEKSGLTGDSRLLLVRNGRYLGKLAISKLEANRAVADVVPDTFPRGVLLQRGDQVILEKLRTN